MKKCILVFFITLSLGAPRLAQGIGFTDRAVFEAAIAGLSSGTLDFESIPADTLLSSAGLTQPVPGVPVSITFPGSVPDVFLGPPLNLMVAGLGSPGSHVLGTDDAGNLDQFIGGTSLELVFTAPVTGFGLTLISLAPLLDGDLVLSAGGETASLAAADVVSTYGYFLGVTSDTPFTTASLAPGAGVPDGAFFYWTDDYTVALPEPGAAPLLALGCSVLALSAARSRRFGETS